MHLKVLINHKIKAEHLKPVSDAFRVHFRVNSAKRVRHESLHPWEEVSHELNLQGGKSLLQVQLKVVDWQFITTFKLAVVLRIWLDGIIGQMHVSVCQIWQIERLRARSEVAIIVHEAFQHAIDTGEHGKGANVKFASTNQQRPLDVLLDDAGPVLIGGFRGNHRFDLAEFWRNFDATASVRIFTWLYDPDVLMPISLILLETKQELLKAFVAEFLNVEG